MQSHRQHYDHLASKVAACVPREGLESVPWGGQADKRRQAPFVSYAMCAAAEALQDSNWHADLQAGKVAAGVAIGAGMSSTQDIAEAGMLLAQVRIGAAAPIHIRHYCNIEYTTPCICPKSTTACTGMAGRAWFLVSSAWLPINLPHGICMKCNFLCVDSVQACGAVCLSLCGEAWHAHDQNNLVSTAIFDLRAQGSI